MDFENEVKDLIFNINEYSQRGIKNIYEVSVLMDSALSLGKNREFKELIFTAKYVNGLKSVLSNRSINVDKYMEKIFDEFNQNLQKFFELMKTMIADCDGNAIKHFNDKYFQMDQENIVNGMGLIEDLSLCKEYLNSNSNKIFD